MPWIFFFFKCLNHILFLLLKCTLCIDCFTVSGFIRNTSLEILIYSPIINYISLRKSKTHVNHLSVYCIKICMAYIEFYTNDLRSLICDLDQQFFNNFKFVLLEIRLAKVPQWSYAHLRWNMKMVKTQGKRKIK